MRRYPSPALVVAVVMPGIARVIASCGSAAELVNTTWRNESGEPVLRVTHSVEAATTEQSAGDLDPGESTSTSTVDAGGNRAHLHTYFSIPVDGAGPSAEIRIAAVSSPKNEDRCLFTAFATSAP